MKIHMDTFYKSPRARGTSLALGALLCIGAGHAQALERAPLLSLDVAQKMAEAVKAKAVEKGWKMNVSIVDSGANPLLFERMDGAALGSGQHAQMKAELSARFGQSTRWAGELAWGKDNKGGALPGVASLPGFVTFPGGLPIKVGDLTIGAVGVSGSLPENDEICAQAGLDAVKALLK
ncbi:MAG TPA: heme-binding protein [Dokdonella sp.]